ncbi:MAG: ATP-grasp domain-containing protein [Geothrix sp.]|nr:ATP-grasp domain-containing protein [Geothrix sp.]
MTARRRLTVGVTGMNARADNPGPGMAVVRSLRASGRFDLRIVGLGYDALDPGLYHEDCDATYLLPYPSTGQDALKERLLDIHGIEGLDALIPCLDAELPSLVSLSPALEDAGIRLYLPDETRLQMRDKSRLPELAKAAGVACPETKTVTQSGFFHSAPRDGWAYPFVVKGPFYDAQIVHDPDEGVAAFRRISAAWGLPLLVQKLVPGEEYNLSAVGDGEGHLLGTVMMKKRALTDKGKAWAGVCVRDQALSDTADALAKALRWRGPLELELMRDPSGRYNLIEINPRFPAWIYFSVGVGRNLPELLLARMMGMDPEPLPEALVGTMFIRHAQELIVSPQSFETMMIHGALAPGVAREGESHE